ncbi:hypothetical protein NC652_032435 [Populus alba x Populus x berolinensis]|nr:hypothetical protein NC652_032435 [Populus alba x Populus x berolinensis]
MAVLQAAKYGSRIFSSADSLHLGSSLQNRYRVAFNDNLDFRVMSIFSLLNPCLAPLISSTCFHVDFGFVKNALALYTSINMYTRLFLDVYHAMGSQGLFNTSNHVRLQEDICDMGLLLCG